MDPIFEYLEKTFDDKRVTSSEKKALLQILKDGAYDTNKRNLIRSWLYDFAREKSTGEENIKVINWLESINKLLVTEITPVQNDIYFSPGTDCRDAILNLIGEASVSIHICVFTISDDKIARAIVAAKKRGLDIKIISDDDKTTDYGSDIQRFSDAQIPVKIDNSPAHMHHKFAVFDKKRVVTGSYNWTRSAYTQNQENILITDHYNGVQKYEDEFQRLWGILRDY